MLVTIGNLSQHPDHYVRIAQFKNNMSQNHKTTALYSRGTCISRETSKGFQEE
jgi:hypothetical protein